MGFTSGASNAGSDNSHFIEIDLWNHEEKFVRLPDNPGDDMVRNKGDLWTISFSKFGFSKKCVTKQDVRKVAIKQGGNDGWHIQSIVTMVRTTGGLYQLFTTNINLNRWVDGNGSNSAREVQLTKV